MASARPQAEPPPPLVEWGDDALRSIFVRVPFFCHGNVSALCHRTRDLLRLPAFREERLESGCAEHAVVVAGGQRDGRATAQCQLLTGGRWLSIAPMSGPRTWHARLSSTVTASCGFSAVVARMTMPAG